MLLTTLSQGRYRHEKSQESEKSVDENGDLPAPQRGRQARAEHEFSLLESYTVRVVRSRMPNMEWAVKQFRYFARSFSDKITGSTGWFE